MKTRTLIGTDAWAASLVNVTVPDAVEAFELDRYQGVARLVLKAALAHRSILAGFEHTKNFDRTKRCAELVAERGAYAAVAADVLGIAMTPTAFEIAIQHAVEAAYEYAPMGHMSREAAAAKRAVWFKVLLHVALTELGIEIQEA